VQSPPEWLNRCKPALAIAANTQKIADTVWPVAVWKRISLAIEAADSASHAAAIISAPSRRKENSGFAPIY
jgi:hypothetical protein